MKTTKINKQTNTHEQQQQQQLINLDEDLNLTGFRSLIHSFIRQVNK